MNYIIYRPKNNNVINSIESIQSNQSNRTNSIAARMRECAPLVRETRAADWLW